MNVGHVVGYFVSNKINFREIIHIVNSGVCDKLIINKYDNCITFNTFVSQRLVLEAKYEQYLLENASNLTHVVLYDNFNYKI